MVTILYVLAIAKPYSLVALVLVVLYLFYRIRKLTGALALLHQEVFRNIGTITLNKTGICSPNVSHIRRIQRNSQEVVNLTEFPAHLRSYLRKPTVVAIQEYLESDLSDDHKRAITVAAILTKSKLMTKLCILDDITAAYHQLIEAELYLVSVSMDEVYKRTSEIEQPIKTMVNSLADWQSSTHADYVRLNLLDYMYGGNYPVFDVFYRNYTAIKPLYKASETEIKALVTMVAATTGIVVPVSYLEFGPVTKGFLVERRTEERVQHLRVVR